jgi:hypothetical protein
MNPLTHAKVVSYFTLTALVVVVVELADAQQLLSIVTTLGAMVAVGFAAALGLWLSDNLKR